MTQSNDNINIPMWIGFHSNDIPQFIEKKNSDWVLFGKDNNYPQMLVDIYDKSAIHNAIITGKCHYIAGEGLRVDKEKVSNVEDLAKVQSMIKRANEDEGLEDVIKKATLDLELFNIIALEVIWKPNGRFDLFHIDASKIRSNADGTEFAYSPDWTKYKKGTEKDIEAGFRTFPKFDPNNKKGSQLYYYTVHRAGKETYTLPEYVGAVPYIHVDYKIADYHLNNLENGFQAGNLIVFSGQYPGDATAKKIERDFAKKFQGTNSKQAGGVMMVWQQEGEGETKVESLMPNNFDKQFMQLLEQTRNMIFTGHRVTSPNLFGVETNESFGNRVEIIEKMEVFQSNYVNVRQRIIERVIQDLYNTDAVYLDRVKPINEQFSEAALLQIMTPAEIREKAGLEVLDEKSSVNDIADKLATVSPLVATKILDNMSVEEIRGIIGLKGDKVVKTTTTTITEDKMSKEDKDHELLFSLLEKMGKPAEGIKCKYSKELEFSGDEVNIDEESFRMSFDINDFDRQVLGVIKANPTLPLENIAEALNTDLENIVESVKRLTNEGMLEANEIDIPDDLPNDTEEVEREVTEEGEREAQEIEYEIVYRYVLRAGVSGGAVIPGTRDFCRELIRLNRVYTKEEIDQISLLTGRNVWLRRGGFWNRGSGNISPSCRHNWRQELIEKQ